MMRKFLLAIATLSVLSIIPACTSGDSKGEEEVVADDGTASELEGLSTEGGESATGDAGLDASLEGGEQKADTTGSPDATVAETATDDQLSIDSFGDSTDQAAAPTEPVPDANAMQEPPAPEPTTPTTTDVATTTGAEEIAPPPTEIPEQNTQAAMTDLDQPKPASKSLQKMAASPWKMGSKWVNGIYFVRPGDSLGSISQAIYGDDRTSELKKINPTYKNRDVKPGDKVYYASVIRPEDSEKVLTLSEEKGEQPLIYTAKEGDNIRKISKELLGYPEAWKEIWAYNTVESKQEIPAGTELRYWMGSSAAVTPDLAKTSSPQPEVPPMPEPPPGMAQNEIPPPPSELPPPPDMASNELPPPPPPPADIPPPPPPPMEMAPPPPPPMAGAEDPGAGGEQDQTLIMGAAGVAVLGFLALMMVRRKRKQKELEQALGETHVG